MKNVRLLVIVTLFLLSTSLVFWGSRASAATGYTVVTVIEGKNDDRFESFFGGLGR